ncbi:SH3 domain-containing protein [Mesobacillus jeotgali]|uniref:SH3 domain-containing protein n=1 Tax=Mesobacillus jeotgali TaxID=129985 RepID=UPI0009A78D81|nr:SH3 domain-containing protein [Mesobacillus jeotgali]
MKNIGKVLVLSTSILVGSSSLPFVPNYVETAEAASVRINTAYATTANLNMRSGPGTNYKVTFTVPKGKTISATERSGNWYKVTYTYIVNKKKTTKTGWVTGAYLRVYQANQKTSVRKTSSATAVVSTAKTTYQTTDKLNIRSGAGTKYKVTRTIPKGVIVYSTARMGSWYKVSYTYTANKKKYTVNGWVSGGYLKEYYQYYNIKGTYYFTYKSTSLFATPDTKKKAVFAIGTNNGFYTTQKVTNSVGQMWYKVSYQGKNVFINSKDVKQAAFQSFLKSEFITNKDAYLFSSYGISYGKLIKIPKNTKFSSTTRVGDWYKVTYGGKTGYIYSKDFIKYVPPVVQPVPEATPVEQTPEPAPAPVETTVPEKEPVSEPVQAPIQPVQTSPVQTQLPALPALTETAISGKTFVTTSSLNLRQTAGTDSAILAVIPNATFVFPNALVSNGWYKVSYAGKTGYVSGTYLKEVVTGDPMHREGYQFIDLRKPSKVSAAQIDLYINNYLNGKVSVLKGKGQAFINAGNKYGVNSLYLAAHAIHESGYGTSNISLGKYNLFGFGAYDASPFIAAVRFSSVEQNIEYIAQEMKATYLNPLSWKYKGAHLGFSTKTVSSGTRIDANSEGMNFYYASDVKWGQKIAAHMQKILPYNKADYDSAQINSTSFLFPSRPLGFDRFPLGVKAMAKTTINLSSQKGSTVIAAYLKEGTIFDIVEKHNDYWVKVMLDNKEYWTNDIKFDRYNQFISVKNLGRVTADSLNIRPTASTALSPIGTFTLNEYVHLVLDTAGNPTTDSTKGWYQVKLADGRTGWVSKLYIIQELK